MLKNKFSVNVIIKVEIIVMITRGFLYEKINIIGRKFRRRFIKIDFNFGDSSQFEF